VSRYVVPATLVIDAHRGSIEIEWDGAAPKVRWLGTDVHVANIAKLDIPTPRGQVPEHDALIAALKAAGWRLTPDSNTAG
jgi:hypothetical protein